jgi:hypothetical protein
MPTPAELARVPLTPEWYLGRLLRALEARTAPMLVWEEYYQGLQPLARARPSGSR